VHLVHLLNPHLFGEHEWELLSGTSLVDGGGAAAASLPPWASPDRAPALASLVAALPATAQAAAPLTSPYVPASPHISPHLPTSPHNSP